MSHNLLYNIIPGTIALAIILGGILWFLVDDLRRQAGRAPLRLRWPMSRPYPTSRVQLVAAPRSSTER
jgi:peptidoglycan/LPS O-acetylase OafA/YrhL